MLALELLVAVLLLVWLVLNLDASRRWTPDCFLDHAGEPASPGDGSSLPRVLAVVPARDEALTIEACLESLFRQETSGACDFAVMLVDDGSTDGTARRALDLHERLAREGLEELPPFRVVTPPATPAGWTGKVHALATGVRIATEEFRDFPGGPPDWFLFTDADITHPVDSVRALLRHAHARQRDLVSVMARLNATSFWERLLIPPFVYFFQLLYPFSRVARDDSRVQAAAGGCVLLRRESLEAAGGLEAIRGALIDDVSLARAVGQAGGRLWLGLDPAIRSIRPYPRLEQIWNMVARSAFVQLRYRYDLLLGTLLAIAVVHVSPLFILALAVVGMVKGSPASGGTGSWWPSFIGAAGVLALQALALAPSVRHHRVPGIFAWTLPVAAALYGAMTFSSAWRHARGRGSRWKGREFTQPTP